MAGNGDFGRSFSLEREKKKDERERHPGERERERWDMAGFDGGKGSVWEKLPRDLLRCITPTHNTSTPSI